MARNCTWRRVCTDAASWHQDEALNATIYIVRQNGPMGFTLKDGGDEKLYKVCMYNYLVYFIFVAFLYII